MLDIVKALWNNRPVRRRGCWLYIWNVRISFETMWRNRPYAYWFNEKYDDGVRRICIPFFTFDILPKEYLRRNR